MKKLLLTAVIVLGFFAVSIASNGPWGEGEVTDKAAEVESSDDEKIQSICPKTKIKDNDKCMDCHVRPDFGLKEASHERNYTLPWGVSIVEGKLYCVIDHISDKMVQDLFNYVYRHPEFQHVVLEINSPGGNLVSAWKIIGLVREAQARGLIVETRCYGMAASAGFLIFIAGDIGHRYVNPTAELMTHELWTFKFFDFATPSSKEQEAEVLRHFQDTIHNWMITRCTKIITKEQLDDSVKHKDHWVNGSQMIDAGFAENAIGE